MTALKFAIEISRAGNKNMNKPSRNPPAESIVFQLRHLGFIESKHLNCLQNGFETQPGST